MPHVQSQQRSQPNVMLNSEALTEMVNLGRKLVCRGENIQPVIPRRGGEQRKQGLLATAEEATGMSTREVDKVRAKEAEQQQK